MPLELVTIPCLSDNYAYLVHDPESGATAAIDVPDAAPILAVLKAKGWKLGFILVTHHHADHIQGVDALRAATGARVAGNAADAHRLPALDIALHPGQTLAVGGETAHVIDVPGHTVGHIAFHFPDSGLLFSADSLMACGCGRLFEGTGEQMWRSLSELSRLPPETLVCSGHEYTAANIRFALSLDPGNPALISRAEAVTDARNRGQPTVPARLSEELATNPFLRAREPQVKARLGMAEASDAAVFTEIRRRKDSF
jgi:hydroxyacylglutathione hydrolase